MEEDMIDRSCMLQESLNLQAAEKPFYEVLGNKYPLSQPPWTSSSSKDGLTSVDHHESNQDDFPFLTQNTYNVYLHDTTNLKNFVPQKASHTSLRSSTSVNYIIDRGLDLDSPASTSHTFDLCVSSTMSRAAIFPNSILRLEEMDLVFLSSMRQGKVALDSFRDTSREETCKGTLKDCEDTSNQVKGKKVGKGRGRKQNRSEEVIDLRTLLITCAQVVATDDRRKANESEFTS
ncbi:hypothetical protein L2E82_12776 [Cichorium intybus]|uniref:Uncharacterized protein n=1 Tax=Cichorium intybus TaxID=13427 RepID=A0ACB9GGW7_CICIN|nr:hypothetical protein L2E82_12776 [Cichorium intybus]